MYIRRVTRKNKKGPPVSYIQLAHNYRDPKTGQARAKVLYNFGREENLDLAALRRLLASISRFLGPQDALAARAAVSAHPQRGFQGRLQSRPLRLSGGASRVERDRSALQVALAAG